MPMKWKTIGIAVVLGAMLLFQSGAQAAEYFVSKQGADANNGASRETAFLTIQKGVDALKPGDTLTIGPGEYFENVRRGDFGGPDADTVIRAEIPGTVLMRGDVDLPEFEKVEGYRFVYAATFDKMPFVLLEYDTLTMLEKRPTILNVEYEPGTFYYDEDQKRLYMSTSDLRAPDGRRYTASVNGKHAIELSPPQRVVIEGLATGGFYPGWGMVLNGPVSCTVRDCTWYLCEGGLSLERGGSDNVIENCDSYAHTFGGIVRFSANNDIIRNCRTYRTTSEAEEYFGIMHYHGMPGTLLIKDNISWGQKFDYSVKPSQQERLENCVALGSIRNAQMFNNLIGGENEYDRDSKNATPDNILFLREKHLNQDFEFADPLNLDFHLQSDSRFRGTGPDGGDSGPYPYEENIFYVSPAGDDEADGLSMRSPWRTLAHAFENLRAGDTLYLAEGQYAAAPLNKAGDGKAPIVIRGRRRGTVVLTETLNLTGGAGIVFEGLNFSRGAALSDSRDVTFDNCTFFGSADGLTADKVEGLNVMHSVFRGVSLRTENSKTVTLSGNIYANVGKPAVRLDADDTILYSDYNSYQNAVQCWEVADATVSLPEVREGHDRYSQTRAPQFVLEKGVPRLQNVDAFNGRGPTSTALGIHYDYDAAPKALQLVGPFLHSVSDTTANIEWWISTPATYELAWGETPEMTNRIEDVRAPDGFTTYSLTGLKPGTKYYFKIRSADTSGRAVAMPAAVLKPETAPLSFTTSAVAPKPAVYYVATDGDDANTGLSREQAWRTVVHAADVINAGDTVLIAGGTYKEDVRVRATGDEGKPITFRCIPGEKVVFTGENLIEAFKVVAKKNINFDGFYFVDFGGAPKAVFVLWGGDGVRITRCFNVKGTGYGGFVSAEYSADVLIKNCVAAQGLPPANFRLCPNWRVENNLLLRPYISAVNFVNSPEQKGYLSKNIITDNLPHKSHAPLVVVGRFESLVESDNCYFLRIPEEKRNMFMFYGTAAYGRYEPEYSGITTDFAEPPVIEDHPDGTENNPIMKLKEYQAMVGDTGSYAGDPKMARTVKMEPGDTYTFFDQLLGTRDIDFPDTFVTDPKAVEKGIGPQREAFKDFWFNKNGS